MRDDFNKSLIRLQTGVQAHRAAKAAGQPNPLRAVAPADEGTVLLRDFMWWFFGGSVLLVLAGFLAPAALLRYFPDLVEPPLVWIARFGPLALVALPLLWVMTRRALGSSEVRALSEQMSLEEFLRAGGEWFEFDLDAESVASVKPSGLRLLLSLILAPVVGWSIWQLWQFAALLQGQSRIVMTVFIVITAGAALYMLVRFVFRPHPGHDARRLLQAAPPYLVISAEGITNSEWARGVIPWDVIERIDRWGGSFEPGTGEERATILYDGYWLTVREAPLILGPLRRRAEDLLLASPTATFSFGMEIVVRPGDVRRVDGAMLKLAPARLKPFSRKTGMHAVFGPAYVNRVPSSGRK